MQIPIIERIAGTTLKVTWTNSGSAPSPIESRIIDRSETIVSTFAAIDSGNGHFYAFHTLPTSYGPLASHFWMINEWRAVLNSYPYYDRQFIKVALPGVD